MPYDFLRRDIYRQYKQNGTECQWNNGRANIGCRLPVPLFHFICLILVSRESKLLLLASQS